MSKKIRTPILYLIPFITGTSLLGYETLCFRLFNPFLGSSVYSYSSVLSFTLLGLVAGYYLSGRLESKKMVLVFILFLLMSYLIFCKILILNVLPITLGLNILSANLISGFIFVFLPIGAMALISPLLIELLPPLTFITKSGMVYALSTLGGICCVIFFAFFLIPNYGLQFSCYLLSAANFLALVLLLFLKNA